MVFGVLRINSPRHKNNHTLCWLPPPLTPSQPITGFYRDASSSWSSFSPDHLFPFTLYSKVLGQRSPKQKYFRLENPLSSMFIQFGGDREKTLCKSIALRIFLFVYPQNILQCPPNILLHLPSKYSPLSSEYSSLLRKPWCFYISRWRLSHYWGFSSLWLVEELSNINEHV